MLPPYCGKLEGRLHDVSCGRRLPGCSCVPIDRQERPLSEQELTATSADTFARLAIELHDAPGVEETIEAVVQFALQALSCTYAGVALHTRGSRAEIAAVTDPVVTQYYELQIATDSGPLITALRERSTVRIRDTSTDDRWPDLVNTGIRSVLDVPLATRDTARHTV